MYDRKRLTSASPLSEKRARLADDVGRQALLRAICAEPIRDEATLRFLCAVLLLDTKNVAVVDLNARNRATRIFAVPLCANHALRDERYIRSLLGGEDPPRRAIAVPVKSAAEDDLELGFEIARRFRRNTERARTFCYLCCGFDIWDA